MLVVSLFDDHLQETILENNSYKQNYATDQYYKFLEIQRTLQKDHFDNFLPLLGLDKDTPISQPFFYENSTDWSFKQLSDYYKKKNTICLSNSLGIKYVHSDYDNIKMDSGLETKGNYRGNGLKRYHCAKFHCDRCRNILKYKLKKEIEREIHKNKLYYHNTITTEGKKYRNKNNYTQSYKDMGKTWNKIRKILSNEAKKQGKKLTYICLFRAQKNGYCHLHLLTNIQISKQRLQEISKRYFNTGFVRVTQNKDIVNYLTNDFLKDHEFYIPFSQHHYSCSQDIKLNIYDDHKDLENPEIAIHIHLTKKRPIEDQIYDQIEHEFGYPPPFPFLLAQFYGRLHRG